MGFLFSLSNVDLDNKKTRHGHFHKSTRKKRVCEWANISPETFQGLLNHWKQFLIKATLIYIFLSVVRFRPYFFVISVIVKDFTDLLCSLTLMI